MNQSKDLPKALPAMELDINFNIEGNVTRKTYSGDFKFRIPNLKARAQADRKRAELNGPIEERFLDPTVANFHTMISYLRFTLVESPKWWRDSDHGYDLYDSNVVSELYSQCTNYENSWMEQVWGKKEESEVAPEGEA
jgi:hypothetical protein